MDEIVQIKFTKRWHVYNEGEVAGFGPERAGELVVSNIGVVVGGAAPVMPEAPVPSEAAKPIETSTGSDGASVVASIAQAVKQG